MEKLLCWLSLGVAAVVLLVFLVDLILGIPFGRLNFVLSVVVAIAAGIVVYISWETLREIK